LGSVDQDYGIEEESAPLLPSSMQQPSSSLGLSMGGSQIAPAQVATSFASVPNISPPLNNLMNQLSFDAWMEQSGAPFIN
jgi:hypothetical protein